MPDLHDDLGVEVDLPRRPRRVVSLVPSLTEAIAATCPEILVGATDWCSHPADLEVTRVRGTKNPNLQLIRSLRPDLVVTNREENRELDVRRLRDSGIQVWTTVIETVPQALVSLHRLFVDALALGVPEWLGTARTLWAGPPPPVRASVAVPIWRDPWMAIGRPTFAGDLLRCAGLANALADLPGRYPRTDPAQIEQVSADLVLLPDEPYSFSADDGPEVFVRTPVRLVSGRLLTWYGPSLVQAHVMLRNLAA